MDDIKDDVSDFLYYTQLYARLKKELTEENCSIQLHVSFKNDRYRYNRDVDIIIEKIQSSPQLNSVLKKISKEIIEEYLVELKGKLIKSSDGIKSLIKELENENIEQEKFAERKSSS